MLGNEAGRKALSPPTARHLLSSMDDKANDGRVTGWLDTDAALQPLTGCRALSVLAVQAVIRQTSKGVYSVKGAGGAIRQLERRGTSVIAEPDSGGVRRGRGMDASGNVGLSDWPFEARLLPLVLKRRGVVRQDVESEDSLKAGGIRLLTGHLGWLAALFHWF